MDYTVKFFIWVGIGFYALTCWAILDIALKDFGTLGKKALWGFVALIPFIGWLLYLMFGCRKGVKPGKE